MKRKLTKRLTALLLSALTVVSALPFLGWGMRVRAAEGADIASVPAVRETIPGSGTFTLTTDSRFFIAADSDPSKTDAGLFVQTVSSEFAAKGIPSANVMPIVYGNKVQAKTGDIIIIPDSMNVDKAQGYRLTVDAKNITVEAKDAAGVLNGLHTVLQSMVRGGTALNACTVNDWPDVAERSVYLDCGRVYFQPETIKALIRTLSWNKMNVLYLDFSNNNATRFFLDEMKVTVAGTTYDITKAKPSNGSLSQADMDGIIAEANKYGVQIIPTFNSPGHIGGIQSVNSSFFKSAAASDYDSGTGKVALNIKDSNAYEFGQKVVKLYVDYFASKGCKSFNIAADEVTDAISGLNSTDSTFVGYVNDLNTYIKSKGMTARMFNDGFRSLDLGFNKDITVMYWTTESLTAQKLIDAGYKVVNLNCHAGLYYAYCGNISSAYVWNQDVDKIYAGWNPGVTSCKVYHWDTYSYAYTPQEWVTDYANEDKLLGAAFAIWTDYAFNQNKDGTTIFAENYKNMMQKIYTVAERSWSTSCTDSYSTWSKTLLTAPAGLSLTGSVLADNLPTPSPITLEATMNTVEDGDVRVSAVGVTGLTASKLTESVSIDNTRSVILYDVTPKAGNDNYTGKGMVSIKIPSAWDNTPIMGVEKTSNGGYRLVAGTSNNGWFSFEVSHFSVYGLAQVNYTGTTPVSVSVGGTKTVTIPGKNLSGTYTTGDETIATVDVKGTDATEGTTKTEYTLDSSVTCAGLAGTTSINDWKKIDGYYYHTDDGDYYPLYAKLTIRQNSYGQKTYTYTWGYSITDSANNVSNIKSTQTSYPRYNTIGLDVYKAKTVTTPATTASTTITFTGKKVGKTSVIIDGTRYDINVNVVADSITLPISIIDYRSDGLLFDYNYWLDNSYAYSLVHSYQIPEHGQNSSSGTSYGSRFAGDNFGTRIKNTWLEIANRYSGDITQTWGNDDKYLNGGWIRTGMVETELGKNGFPVYTSDTVYAVANLLRQGIYDSQVISSGKSTNKEFVNTFLVTNAPRSVRASTTPTAMSTQFAQAQTYDNIANAYDLAWYLLNNLFVPDTNMVTDGEKTVPIYGMATNTYKGIVLKKTTITDSDGNTFDGYAYDSLYSTTYDKSNQLIYNTDAPGAIITTKPSEDDIIRFWPIDGEGYDSSEYYGGNTSVRAGTKPQNGNFALVGTAEFIYKENDYFYFSGDDDVYLYINGKLALDLGGAHGVCYKEIKLSELGGEYGLVEGQPATFTFFYMERCSDNSNFSMRTNIEMTNSSMQVEKNAYPENSNAPIPSGSAVPSYSNVIYDFVVRNTGNTDMTNLVFADNDGTFGNTVYFGGNGANSTGTGKAKLDLKGPFTVWFESNEAGKNTFTSYADANNYIKTLTLPAGDVLHVKGLRGIFTPDLNDVFTYENTLTVTAIAGNSTLKGNDTHKLYSFNIGDTTRAYVVDFGLPMTIEKLFDIGTDAASYIESVTRNDEKSNVRHGSYVLSGEKVNTKLTYTLTSPIDSAEVIVLDVNINIEGTRLTTHKHITIIPATTVYYEDTFSDFIRFEGSGCSWTTDGTTVSKEQSADRIAHSGNVYGYDQAYDTMSKFSLGSAHKVTVSGSNYATAKFSFYGTGFDVISATTNTSGTIVVSVTGENGYSKNYLVDTYYGYTYDSVTGEWTPAPDTAKALWQIPVMKVANLDYGKYDVTITVAYADFFAHGQNGGGSYDFWLDAVRIYDPAGAVAGVAGGSQENYENAYKADGECWPTYMELRDMIIRDKSFAVDSAANGMIFIDGQTGNVSMADYTSYGPNNELYLANGQAVAFRLNAAGNVADIQIALKNIVEGKNASCKIFAVGSEPENGTVLATATDMYRSIKDLNGKTVVIMNVGDADSILSITNLKVTYSEKPGATDTLSLTMDEKSALAALSAVDEVLNPKTPFEPGKVDVRVEDKDITVITSPDVDGIEIDGEKVTDFTVDSETGNRIWKKPIDRILKDNPEISVVARDSNGNVSAPVTAPVVAGGSIGALIGGFIGRLIKNILSVLFG